MLRKVWATLRCVCADLNAFCFLQTYKYHNNPLVLLLILRQEVRLLHRLGILHGLLGSRAIVEQEHHTHHQHRNNGDPINQYPRHPLQSNIPYTAMVNHLHSLIEKRRSIVVTISLVEDCQSHLILLRVDEVVQTKHIQEVHLIARIQSRIEVTLCELTITLQLQFYILVIHSKVVCIVQRSHAVGNIVHSYTCVLQIHNHTNRLSNWEILYKSANPRFSSYLSRTCRLLQYLKKAQEYQSGDEQAYEWPS